MRNVKLWFAYDENGGVVKINDADIDKNYSCPCCGANVFPKATKSKKISMHFCHINGESCSDNGGESYIHKWIKTVLFTPNQSIKVNTKDGIKEYTIKEVKIEERYRTSQGDYIPDITVISTDNKKIFVEIYNTNKKSIKKYWLKWFELKEMVIEVSIKDILANNFELGILEPIYEDSDRFRHFKESDYRKLIGKKVDERERERIKKLYNNVYDYVNRDGSISEIVDYHEWELKKYICTPILNDILSDIKCYKNLLRECIVKGIGVFYPANYYSDYWRILAISRWNNNERGLGENVYYKPSNELTDEDKKFLTRGIEDYVYKIEHFSYKSNRNE